MQLNIVFIATALLASALLAMSATVTAFAGADCTGTYEGSFEVSSGECLTLGSGPAKSISYSGVPNQIQFYVSDACANGPQLVFDPGSACVTAPAGFNWASVQVF